MRRRIITYMVVLTLPVLLGICLDTSARTATPNDSWGYPSSCNTANRPVSPYRQPLSASRVYTPASRSISAFDPSFKDGAKASTYFQYTPADALLSDYSSDRGGMPQRVRRSSAWDDPDDNPVGVVTNPTPAGEPFVMLALALLYALILFVRVHLLYRTVNK